MINEGYHQLESRIRVCCSWHDKINISNVSYAPEIHWMNLIVILFVQNALKTFSEESGNSETGYSGLTASIKNLEVHWNISEVFPRRVASTTFPCLNR